MHAFLGQNTTEFVGPDSRKDGSKTLILSRIRTCRG